MRAAEHQHTQARLADAAANRQRQLAVEQRLVEGQLAAILAAGFLELARKALCVDADAHGADFKGAIKHFVIEKNVAVQLPVVIVGRAAVVLFAGAERFADLHDERGAVLAGDFVFALRRGQVGVHILQLLAGDEKHAARKLCADFGKLPFEGVARHADRIDDARDRLLEVIDIPVGGGDDLLPVPLVDIHRVEIVQRRFVAADGVHVGIQTVARIEVVALERPALPFGQRMHHFKLTSVRSGHVEGNGTLHAVEVIVQAGIRADKQRSGHALEIECRAQILLEALFDKHDGSLHLIYGEPGAIARGDNGCVHSAIPPCQESGA